MSRAESIEVLFPLMAACKAGDLDAVASWIAAGKPLDPPDGKRSRRRSPLEIAIEKGFLTLTKKLLAGGADPLANGNALDFAVQCGHVDHARALLDHGVDVNSVDFSSVCWRENPEMIRLFIERGADVTTNEPLYHGLVSSVQPLLGIIKEFRGRFPDWQKQLDRALLHHVGKSSTRNVALLVWAGAKPNVAIVGEEHEIERTALEDSALYGNLEIVKLLKPELYPNFLDRMLRQCWLRMSVPVVEYLIELGAKMNDESGGSELLETVIRHKLEDWLGTSRDVEPALRFIEHLCGKNAKWLIQDIKEARRSLRRVPGDRLFRLISILLQHKAADPTLIQSILATPGMRARLGTHFARIDALLHPPVPKPTPTNAAPPPPAEPLLTDEQIQARAEEWLLTVCVEGAPRSFSQPVYRVVPTTKLVLTRLGLTKEDTREPYRFVGRACAAVNKRLTTAKISCDGAESRSRGAITVELKDNAEWLDLFREANPALGYSERYWLDAAGQQLYELLQAGEFSADPMAEAMVKRHLGRHAPDNLGQWLADVSARTNGEVRFEELRGASGELRFRIWHGDAVAGATEPTPMNPVLDVDFEHLRKGDFDLARSLLHKSIQDLKPAGTSPAMIYVIRTRRELRRCFPRLPMDRWSTSRRLVELFSGVPLAAELSRAYDFREDAPTWHFSLEPNGTWSEVVKVLSEQAAVPPLETRLGISADAARLLTWLQQLPPGRLTSGWSPNVEDANDREIGLNPPTRNQDFAFFLRVVLDEINERTPYTVTSYSYTEYSSAKTRLKLVAKPSELDSVVRQLQLVGLQQGRLLTREAAVRAVEMLLANAPADAGSASASV